MITSTDVGGQRPRMPTATANPDRRAFLAQAACSLALGATVTAASAAAAVDPVFAAIEAHKAANRIWHAALNAQALLERELPAHMRRSHVAGWGDEIHTTDDPRWIECERVVSRTSDAEQDAAIALLNVRPSSMAGVTALLQYAAAFETSGEEWPDDLVSDDGVKSRSWHGFLIEMLAETLPDLLAVRS